MDEMEIDSSSAASTASSNPQIQIFQSLTRIGVSEECLKMGHPGIVEFVKNENFPVLELVRALLPSEEFVESLKDAKSGHILKLHYGIALVWLKWIMFMGDPSVALERLSSLSSWRGVCSAIWGDNDIAFKCRTCENDPTCAICVPCFTNGSHRDHDYSVIYTSGGCCDCGDATAWKREGFCSKHKGADLIVPLPEEFSASVGPVLYALFSVWKDKILSVENFRNNSESVLLKEKAANMLSLSIVEMIIDFCDHSESLLSFVSKQVISLVGFLDILVKAESFLSHGVIIKLQEMLLKLLGEPSFKYEFTKSFLSYYPSVVQQILCEGTDTGLKKYTLLQKFSVQIFTVPKLTPQLVKEMDLLSMLLRCLVDIFVYCAGDTGCLSVSKWGNLYEISIRVVEDIRFVLSHESVPRYVICNRKDVIKTWMNILGYMQGMSPLKRQTGIHVDDEDENMNLPFFLGNSIVNINNLLVDGAFDSAEASDGASHDFNDDVVGGTCETLAKVKRLSRDNVEFETLLPSSVGWLASECLQSIEKFLEPQVNYKSRQNHSKSCSSRKKFFAVKEPFSMFKKGKHIFGGSFNSNVPPQTFSATNMDKTYKMELQTGSDMMASDCLSGIANTTESNRFDLLNLREWQHIAYDVSLQEISIHMPLHRLLASIMQRAIMRVYGEVTDDITNADASTILSDFFGYILKGTHPYGLSGFTMEHPLRNRVFFAQVRAGMWRKNGDAAVMSCEWAEQGLELDLFWLQCCAILAPANDYIHRMGERFGILNYLTLNSDCSEEHEFVLVHEMLVLLIQIMEERRYSGLCSAENLRRELIHKLAVGDATRSQIVKSLPSDLSKLDKLQEVLDSVATYSNPTGFNQGVYSLREACWKELDLYYPRWSSRDLQIAEERLIRYSSNLSIATQLPQWKNIYKPFEGLARIAICKMAIQVVRSVFFYAVYNEKFYTPGSLLLSALHFLSLSVDIFSRQRESDRKIFVPADIDKISLIDFATEEIRESCYRLKDSECLISLLVSLMKMQKDIVEVGGRDIYGLIQSLLKKFAKLDPRCTLLLQKLAPDLVVLLQPKENSYDGMNKEASGSDKRREKARKRQAAIMAKMKADQSKFLSSLSSVDEPKSNLEESCSDAGEPSNNSMPNSTCSLCHDQNSNSPISFLVLLQKSRLLSFSERVPPSWDGVCSEKLQFIETKRTHDESRLPNSADLSLPDTTACNSDDIGSLEVASDEHDIDALERNIYFSSCRDLIDIYHELDLEEQQEKVSNISRRNIFENFESCFLRKYLTVFAHEFATIPSASEKNVNCEAQNNSNNRNSYSRDGFTLTNCDGIYLSSCGHAVHRACLDRYLSSLKERHVRSISFEGGHIVNIDQGEFLCPVCRCLANSILPIGADNLLNKPIMWIQESDAINVDSTSLFVHGINLLQSISNVIRNEDTLNTIHPRSKIITGPDLDYICRILLEIHSPSTNERVFQLSRVNYPIIMWDVLTYSLSSTEIAARCRKTDLDPVYSIDTLHQELKSPSGFALSLLLSIVQCSRSHSPVHLLQRFYGMLLFESSICYGVQISSDSLLSLEGENGSNPVSLFWDRAANPILAHDSFSSLMWILFCLPHPFMLCEKSFLALVHVFYAITVVQAIIVSSNKSLKIKRNRDIENGLITEIFNMSREGLCQYFVTDSIDKSSDIHETVDKLTFPFLRRCSLLWKIVTSPNSSPFNDTEFLSSSDHGLDERKEINKLKTSFMIPELAVFLKNPKLKLLAMRWIQHFQSFNNEYAPRAIRLVPSVPLRLIRLPHLYQDLLQRYVKQSCVYCLDLIEEPALCLFCGKLCVPNLKSCCRENRCQSHAIACGAGTGIYLMLRRTTVLLQRASRQSPWPSLYLDAYGEEDIEMFRGKPLYLNEERYAYLTHMVPCEP